MLRDASAVADETSNEDVIRDAGSPLLGDAAAQRSDASSHVQGADAGAFTDASKGDGSALIPPNYCEELPELAAVPEIDGQLEVGLATREVVPLGWPGDPTAPAGEPRPGNSSRLAVAWHPEGLYFFVEVTDPERIVAPGGEPTFHGDGVEFYVDADGAYLAPPAYDDPGTRQFVVVAPSTDDVPSARGEIYQSSNALLSSWGSSEFGAFPTSTGYVVEAFVRAADLGLEQWELSAGATVGFDFAHNVSGDVGYSGDFGYRMGQYVLEMVEVPAQAIEDYPHSNTLAFCTPVLLGP